MKKQNCNKKILIIFLSCSLVIAVALTIRFFYWANDTTLTRSINTINQNALLWVHKNNRAYVQPAIHKKLAQNYLNKYFSPWNGIEIKKTPEETHALETATIQKYRDNPNKNCQFKKKCGGTFSHTNN